jgi:hypothetical protein
MTTNALQNYKRTYSGKKLLEKHRLDEYGIWHVRGEDPNCDFGGHHYMPDLGVYEGELEDILTLVVELPQFWTWGAGGEITKRNVTQVDPTTRFQRNEKRAKLAELEAEVEKLKKDLNLT